MIKNANYYESKFSRGITMKELYNFLAEFLAEHPELKNMKVSVASEGGYSGANIAFPPMLAVSATNECYLVSTDDGHYDNPAVDWIFYAREGEH